MSNQAEKAELLLRLHQNGAGLLLPNAWDIASARIVEAAGFPVIATTSGGIAFATGLPDGQRISRDEMLGVVARIAAAVQIPVTADVEAGYGSAPEAVAATIDAVIAAGAVGINLEDSQGRGNPLITVEAQAERIRAAREAADRAGIHVVINARTDTYLFQIGEESTRFDDTLRRARAYVAAGADCIFVPGVSDKALIQQLVAEIDAPVNILVGAGSPSLSELFALGVARVSLGSSIMTATMGYIRDIVSELRESGTYNHLVAHPYSYAEATRLFN